LDDIIVFSKTPAEHMARLEAVLHRLYRAGLTLNLKKCHFFKETVDYLGHVIRPGATFRGGEEYNNAEEYKTSNKSDGASFFPRYL
jgi:Reverse transcriptase (RNA-dependent DNA polymerase)